MVNIVNHSVYSENTYKEINSQLAKENGELKLLLSELYHELASERERSHKKDVQILQLEAQIKDFSPIKIKFDAITDIIFDNKTIESSRYTGTLLQITNSSISHGRRLVGDSATDESESDNSTRSLVPIQEQSEEEQVSSDSLDPPDVTSVPTLGPEKIFATPSICHCLDSDDTMGRSRRITNSESPTRFSSSHDMFQSTPVSKGVDSSNANYSTAIRELPKNTFNNNHTINKTFSPTPPDEQQKLNDRTIVGDKENHGAMRDLRCRKRPPAAADPVGPPLTYNLRKRTKV